MADLSDPRDARIAELESENAELKARIVELEGKVIELAKLKEQLEQNSRNSGKPPSSDTPQQRAQRPSKDGSGRKRGGQPGHEGSKRELTPVEEVDELNHVYPRQCESCWKNLPSEAKQTQRYQMVELPAVRLRVSEWQRHCVSCPDCGHETWGSMASMPSTSFGPRLSAVIGLLTGFYHLSRRATVRFLSDVLGTEISLGAVSAVEERVSESVKPAVAEAWETIEAAPVKHTDGTSWYQSHALCALWTIATSAVTVFKILANGQATTLAPLFGKCVGILVSDRATALKFWVMARRQICWAHLLRKAISFSERDGPSAAIGHELLDYITLIFDYWHRFKAGTLSREQFRSLMAPVRQNVEGVLTRAAAQKLGQLSGSCADILEHRAALWTFVDQDGVEPTNNHAERELRAFVLWRKKSFGSQSDRGNLFAERIMTVVHTARKQKKNVLEFLTDCCTAKFAGTKAPSLFASA